jgi:hypothetical protein
MDPDLTQPVRLVEPESPELAQHTFEAARLLSVAVNHLHEAQCYAGGFRTDTKRWRRVRRHIEAALALGSDAYVQAIEAQRIHEGRR